MDKGRKLRRYSRKDYTQLVDFPVEIVGRDGVVRRYSFEESVRLYQRRIASASMRYEDGDIVKAEVGHCRRRIEQLRKSYFARYGWAALRVPGGGQLDGELAGEVAAFLRKCLGSRSAGGLDGIELSFLGEDDDQRLYFVQGEGGLLGDGSAILYLYRFETGGACSGREGFFQYLKVLQAVRKAGPGIETLVAFHHTADCGLILTRQAPAAGHTADPPVTASSSEWDDDEDAADDPVRDAMALLRKGRESDALDLLECAYEEHPYRRSAYMAAVVVADQLGAHDRGETAALMGSRYFPEDRLLVYHLAVARLRSGAVEAARPVIAEMRQDDAAAPAVQLAAGVLSLLDDDVAAGHRRILRASRGAAPDSDIQQAGRLLQLQLTARRLLRLGGFSFAIAGVGGVGAGHPWLGVVALLVGCALVPVGHRVWRRRLLASLAGPGARGLRLATAGALQVEDANQGHQ